MTVKRLEKNRQTAKVSCVMSTPQKTMEPWWLLPHLLGVDVAVAAFLWSSACTHFLRANLIGSGALLLVSVAAWVCVMVSRVVRAIRGPHHPYAAFYRRHLSWLLPLVLCACMAAVWMLFFYVGQGLLAYVPYALVLLVGGLILPDTGMRCFCRSLSFVYACFAPAYFYAAAAAPLSTFFSWQLWWVVAVFWLFFVHRDRVARSQGASMVLTGGCGVLFMWLVISLWNANASDGPFYCFMTLALACLHVLCWRLRHLSGILHDALDWWVMAACAGGGSLLSLSFF